MQSRTGTTKQILARFQRLCCLGIGDALLVPEVIREVMQLIPSRNGVFFWVGPELEVVNSYGTIPPRLSDLFFKEFYLTSRETAVLKTFSMSKHWPTSTPVRQLADDLLVDHRAFLRSDFYNQFWRVAGNYHSLKLCIRSANQVHGLLQIHRAEGEPPYEHHDIRTLEATSNFIAHGMTQVTLREDTFTDSDDRALLIANSNGTIQHADRPAQHLLAMALNPHFSPTTRVRGLNGAVPEISRLCSALIGVSDGHVGQQPPVLWLRNPWGQFVLRAYWLGPTDGVEQTRQVAITIERQVPQPLAFRKRIEKLSLTGREKQLCLLLLQDRSRQNLADAMGVSAGTIVTYQSSIYVKLGVHSRRGLLAALS